LTSLYTKDFLRISDHGFSFLKKQLDISIPSIHVIKKMRGIINKNFDIQKLGDGCIVDPKRVIIDKIIKLHEKSPSIFENERIKVKLSADGTNISKNIKILNVIFSIINEDLKAATASGSYLFALAPYEKENYDQIAPLMSRTWDLIKGLSNVEINNVVKYIDLFVCADYKMNLNLAGLKMANSLEPCLYCTASKRHLHKLADKRKVMVNATLTKLENGKKICEILDEDFYDIALYDYIIDENDSQWIHSDKMLIKLPINRFIIDLLHLFLRISDKLFSNLIEKIKTIDNFSDKYNPKKHKNMAKIISYLKECKIPIYDFFYEENTISKIFTSLQGPHRIKVFNRIVNDDSFLKLLESMPKIEKPVEIYLIWKDFYLILTSIKSEQLPDLDYTQGLINNWFVKYVSLYTQTSVTPYMHMFTYHLIDQFKKYGNINYFNTQGLEKFNDLSTMDYFKATNKKDDYCFQILKRNMRMNFLDSIINIKPKRKYTRRLEDYTDSNEDEIEADDFENDDDADDISSRSNKIRKTDGI
jgi:hypothetical protein